MDQLYRWPKYKTSPATSGPSWQSFIWSKWLIRWSTFRSTSNYLRHQNKPVGICKFGYPIVCRNRTPSHLFSPTVAMVILVYPMAENCRSPISIKLCTIQKTERKEMASDARAKPKVTESEVQLTCFSSLFHLP